MSVARLAEALHRDERRIVVTEECGRTVHRCDVYRFLAAADDHQILLLPMCAGCQDAAVCPTRRRKHTRRQVNELRFREIVGQQPIGSDVGRKLASIRMPRVIEGLAVLDQLQVGQCLVDE